MAKRIPVLVCLLFAVGCGQKGGSSLVREAIFDGVRVSINAEPIHISKSAGGSSADMFYYVLDLKIEGRPMLPAAIETPWLSHAHSPDLQAVSLHFSPDKKHFVVALSGKVRALYHLLPAGAPFGADFFRTYSDDFADTISLEWDLLPEPALMISAFIYDNRRYRELGFLLGQQMALALSQQPAGSAFDSMLLQKYPESDLAQKALLMGKAHQLSQNPHWRESLRQAIARHANNMTALEVNSMLAHETADTTALKHLDQAALPGWLKEYTPTAYLASRINDTLPIATETLAAMKKAALLYIPIAKTGYGEFLGEALMSVDKAGSPAQWQNALRMAFGGYRLNDEAILRVLIEQHHLLKQSSEACQMLVEHFGVFSEKEQRLVFDFLSQKLPCKTLKKLISDYPALKEKKCPEGLS